MGLIRLYRFILKGQIDELVEEIEKLSGDEKIEGELLKEYFLLEYKSTDVKGYIELAEKVINDNIN
ncbi:MAG: hypothetical protein ACXABU_16905, partial [Candidatus Hodarchaeales archaeon]